MIRSLRGLAVRAAVITAIVLVITLALAQFDLVLDPAVPVAIGLLLAVVLWTMRADVDRDDALTIPERTSTASEQSPHGGDLLVRRNEELITAVLSGSDQRQQELAGILTNLYRATEQDPFAPPRPHLAALAEAYADPDSPGAAAAAARSLGDRDALHQILLDVARTKDADPASRIPARSEPTLDTPMSMDAPTPSDTPMPLEETR